GQSGIDIRGPAHSANGKSHDPFIALVSEEGRTACIEDLTQIQDRSTNGPTAGFHSVLAAPLSNIGQVNGVLAVYGRRPRDWSEAEFDVIQWFAAQASLVLQSLRLQNELDERSRQAEESSRQKTRFLAAVSHDVRNPANAI